MKNNLFQIFSNLELTSSFEAYTFIGNILYPDNERKSAQVLSELSKREQIGNIQIDKGVVLPHLESEIVSEAVVVILKPKKQIQIWNEAIKEIDLIISVMLSPQASNHTKKRIASFMRKLADEKFLAELRSYPQINE